MSDESEPITPSEVKHRDDRHMQLLVGGTATVNFASIQVVLMSSLSGGLPKNKMAGSSISRLDPPVLLGASGACFGRALFI